MSKVNEQLRRERRERISKLAPAERVALAEKLGEEGLAAFMSAHHLERSAAMKAIRRSRAVGRRRSVSADEKR